MVNVNNWWKNLLKTVSKSGGERSVKVLDMDFLELKKWVTRRFTQVFSEFSQEKCTNNLYNSSLLNWGFPGFPHSLLLSLLNI